MASTPRVIDAGVGVGEIFLDKFRVDAILGHGGMGVVALCTHLALNERVAIKMLRRDVLDDPESVERFMREAQAASKLKSEYVARVTDVGRSRANVPYMVMEYLEGHDLDELLEERGSLGQPWAIEITIQACEALAEAHSIGIVHRDVKPSNLFVTWRPDGSALIKVLDFGISKALTGESMRLTQTQSLLGTPAYMSPEQMRSARHVDGRTDIWSLGTVLYEMLEGRRPFEAESFSEMCVKVAVDDPAAMTRTPLPLQQVVMRCLAKQPEQRYASMAELARDLVPFSHDRHQAQVLAERMARTLRRSQLFDGDPAHLAGSQSGERLIERSVTPADRVMALPAPPPPPVTAAASDPAIRVPPPSKPAQPLSSTYAVPRRKRRTGLLVAAALAGAATIGVVISQIGSPAPSRPAVERARRATPAVPVHVGAPPASGAATPPTGAATPSTGVATPSTGVATPSTGAATPSTGAATPSTGAAPVATSNPGADGSGSGSRKATGPGIGKARPARAGTPSSKAGAPSSKAGTPSSKAGTPSSEAGEPACDAFGSAHATNASCPPGPKP